MQKLNYFDKAFEILMILEGGYNHHKHDRGGETKFGISKRSYPHLNIKNINLKQAKEIYLKDFWLKYDYSRIDCFDLAMKVFITAVNTGPLNSHKCVQRALRAVGRLVIEDGLLGSKTIYHINSSNAMELLASFKSESAGYYRNIVEKSPSQQVFLNGWLNRAYL